MTTDPNYRLSDPDAKAYWIVQMRVSRDEPTHYPATFHLMDVEPDGESPMEWVEVDPLELPEDWERSLDPYEVELLDKLPQVYALKLGVEIKVPHADERFKGHIWLPKGSQHRVVWIQKHRGQRLATIQYTVEIDTGEPTRTEVTGRALVVLSNLHSYRHFTRIRPNVFAERFEA